MNQVAALEATYILISGLVVSENIELNGNVALQPADTSHLDFMTAVSTCSKPDDIAVVAAFIPRVTAQLKVSGITSQDLVTFAWNSFWDTVLLSAIFHTEISFNLQSDTEASQIDSSSHLRATNLEMRGLSSRQPYKLTTEDLEWIRSHYQAAAQLLETERFKTAIHCLATYRWHSLRKSSSYILAH